MILPSNHNLSGISIFPMNGMVRKKKKYYNKNYHRITGIDKNISTTKKIKTYLREVSYADI